MEVGMEGGRRVSSTFPFVTPKATPVDDSEEKMREEKKRTVYWTAEDHFGHNRAKCCWLRLEKQ
jgi:hypothetical protein